MIQAAFSKAFADGQIPFPPELKGRFEILKKSPFFSRKADLPVAWWNDARSLELLLRGAWNEISADFLAQIQKRLSDLDPDAMDQLAKMADGLGVEVSKAIGNKAEALLINLEEKAHAAWILHGKAVLDTTTIAPLDPRYREYLAQVQATQVKKFAEAFPKRILHPEILRQAQYLRDSDLTRSIDMSRFSERLERAVKQERYWEGLSDVQTARLWHTDGVLLAHENGIKYCQISGPFDERTCPVCNRMIGMRIAVAPAIEKIRSDIMIIDPDKYVEAWPFPRIGDIDNMSRAEIENKGLMPPFHNRCRHGITWLSK